MQHMVTRKDIIWLVFKHQDICGSPICVNLLHVDLSYIILLIAFVWYFSPRWTILHPPQLLGCISLEHNHSKWAFSLSLSHTTNCLRTKLYCTLYKNLIFWVNSPVWVVINTLKCTYFPSAVNSGIKLRIWSIFHLWVKMIDLWVIYDSAPVEVFLVLIFV